MRGRPLIARLATNASRLTRPLRKTQEVLAIDLAAMADLDHQHHKFPVFHFTDNAIIPDAVFPIARKRTGKRFTQ